MSCHISSDAFEMQIPAEVKFYAKWKGFGPLGRRAASRASGAFAVVCVERSKATSHLVQVQSAVDEGRSIH